VNGWWLRALGALEDSAPRGAWPAYVPGRSASPLGGSTNVRRA
jgi:hypothetical protein